MKKAVFILVLIQFRLANLSAQTAVVAKSNSAAAGINIAAGGFSETHIVGFHLGYSWSHHHFGEMRAHPKKRIGFITQAGADYYLGRSEMVAGYHYKYGNYLYFDALAGAIYNPSRKSNISFSAGPSIGIYKKHGEFGFALNCEGSYYFTGKFAITPAIVYMKAHETDALWAGSLQLTLAF